MGALPFAVRRPWLLLRDALVDRDRPDLARLRRLEDPERFFWAILPHAARTFSACIVMLPSAQARAAGVGYLYSRMLDTYEDLHPDAQGRDRALQAFAARFEEDPLPAAPAIPGEGADDHRDRGHLLLLERCALIDRVYADLDARQRTAVRDLVRKMSAGMRWSSDAFRRQGGVLADEVQLLRYCRNVLGQPVAFTLRLLRGELTARQHEDAMEVGELIQLANVTRDIEKDLLRGLAYHPALRDDLGCDPARDAAVAARVREVRGDLLRLALQRAPAYGRMVDALDGGRLGFARASAVLMLLFTDRYYRSCARRCGLAPWPGPRHIGGLIAQALPAVVSRRWTRRVVERIERAFLRAARRPADR